MVFRSPCSFIEDIRGGTQKRAPPLTRYGTLVDAAVFGGPKSKLRSMVIPYHTGEVWIYSNPIKNSNKISDFKVSDYRIGLSDNLTRIWCAAFAAELAVKLKGNIDWQIINSFLTGIAVSSESECRKALLRFLWRVISLSGLAPDMEHCCRCGIRVSSKMPETDCLNNTESLRKIANIYTLFAAPFCQDFVIR